MIVVIVVMVVIVVIAVIVTIVVIIVIVVIVVIINSSSSDSRCNPGPVHDVHGVDSDGGSSRTGEHARALRRSRAGDSRAEIDHNSDDDKANDMCCYDCNKYYH